MGKKLKVLSLFAGIGGFDLGLERANNKGAEIDGFETVAFCEIEEFPRKVLAKHWPDVPCYRDVRELTAEQLAADGIAVDVVTGGFPCQAFSSAARGRNNAPDLWPEMARVVSQVGPQCVIAENVKRAPIIVAANYLTSLGMFCDVVCIPANAIGADHERVRWWLIAHPHENGEFSRALNAEVAKLPTIFDGIWGAEAYRAAVTLSDGFSGGLDEVGTAGNAVVPQIPELIGNAILQSIQSASHLGAEKGAGPVPMLGSH